MCFTSPPAASALREIISRRHERGRGRPAQADVHCAARQANQGVVEGDGKALGLDGVDVPNGSR